MTKKTQIRNSTAEFLVFTKQAGESTIDVRIEDETVWLTQKLLAVLFEVDVRTISEHLINIFNSHELEVSSVIRRFRITAADGKNYNTQFYNLDAIISVGYRVNSERATQFRQWATNILRDFAIRGYVLDKERLKNGAFFSKKYFDDLLAEIREIRASERAFYQKITDIYVTAMDYSKDATTTKKFFASVQNKLHYAIHGQTAAEVIMNRANAEKEHMGLTSWKNAPDGKIIKTDVSIAKNYLKEQELISLDRFITMYLDYAEDQAERGIPMSMNDWVQKLNAFLQFNQRDILDNPGLISAEIAKAFAETEFEKYRIAQDQLYESDFDKAIKKLNEPDSTK
ncbi:MAG: virulence RhuM family protein [Bacteroidetes bacterium]|nr:virulence RhuM family protein [Bacteroidota bacterium]